MGRLIGAAQFGGPNGLGAMFALTHTFASKDWTESTLYGFTGSPNDGSSPQAFAVSGEKVIGVTTVNAQNAIFELVPEAPGSTTMTSKILFTFSGKNGIHPNEPIFGPDGAIYGTTAFGGANFDAEGPFVPGGVVYRLDPPKPGETEWTQTILYDFSLKAGIGDGFEPGAPVTFGPHGEVLGTTSFGGDINSCGVVFELTPPDKGVGE